MHSATSRGALAALVFSAALFAQADPGDFVKQGQALTRLGKQDDALTLYRAAIDLTPNSYAANSGAGAALDLKGDYAEARKYFTRAIETARSTGDKVRALRDMALSYGFESNCKAAVGYDRQAFDLEFAAKDFYNAGEVADELAGICLDAGDLDAAGAWYQTGHEAGLREPDIQAGRKNLWEFRWEHALARIAARRGDRAEAQKHVAAATALLATGDNPQQQQFLYSLMGYVAFYGGDYKAALEQFFNASRTDAFVLVMIAQTYEKLGDKSEAMDWYRRALEVNAHTPPVAHARPLARKKLGT